MKNTTVAITSKGQVTIPKKIREKLNSNLVYFEEHDDVVIVRPVRDVAGSLSKYAKNADITIRQMKEKAWGEAVIEKTDKRTY